MKTHYSTAQPTKFGTWFTDETGRMERYGFGFDHVTPYGSKSAAFATYEFDPASNVLTVGANPGAHYGVGCAASMRVKCGDAAQALDYAARLDAALSPIVAEAVPRSLGKAGFDLPRWTDDPVSRGRDLLGLVSGRALAEVLDTADRAVRRSYGNDADEDFGRLSARSGLKPIEYRAASDGFWFRGGPDTVFFASAGLGIVVHSSRADEHGDFPVVAEGRTAAFALTKTAENRPDLFEGLIEAGKKPVFKEFLAFERGTMNAAACIARATDHRPYEEALRLLGTTPAGRALQGKMRAQTIDSAAPVKTLDCQAEPETFPPLRNTAQALRSQP